MASIRRETGSGIDLADRKVGELVCGVRTVDDRLRRRPEPGRQRAAFWLISGPIPDGSPAVMAMTGLGTAQILTASQSATIFGLALRSSA